VLVLVPLVPLAIVGGLVALPFILPLWLLRTVRRGRRRRGDATGPPGRRSRRRPTLDLRDPLNELVHEAKPLPAIVATTPPIETNAAATSPATGALRHGPKTTAAAAVSRMIGPEGIVGKSSPEKYWIMIPAAATARPAALSLAAGDSCA
jgi:hypothetical protein